MTIPIRTQSHEMRMLRKRVPCRSQRRTCNGTMPGLLLIVALGFGGSVGASEPTASVTRGLDLLLNKAYLPPEFDDAVFDQLWMAWEEPLRTRAEAATLAERRRMAYARYGFTPRPGKENDPRPLQYTAAGAEGWSAN